MYGNVYTKRIGEGKYKEVGKQPSISVGVRKRGYNGSNIEEKRVTVVKSRWNAVTRHFCALLCGAILKRSKYKLLYKFTSLCSRKNLLIFENVCRIFQMVPMN